LGVSRDLDPPRATGSSGFLGHCLDRAGHPPLFTSSASRPQFSAPSRVTLGGGVAPPLDEDAGMGSMQPEISWPFAEGVFPAGLLAIVQRTVADGTCPALMVIHDDEDDWLLCDNVHDPNSADASTVLHLDHVLALDPSLADLAGLPPGHIAERTTAQSPWAVRAWTYTDAEAT